VSLEEVLEAAIFKSVDLQHAFVRSVDFTI